MPFDREGEYHPEQPLPNESRGVPCNTDPTGAEHVMTCTAFPTPFGTVIIPEDTTPREPESGEPTLYKRGKYAPE
jgi:hypothetical protein